ncbi:hypothetical protein [Citrobacter koseri]|nr:hypothetical protein [Citrobacter koseri]
MTTRHDCARPCSGLRPVRPLLQRHIVLFAAAALVVVLLCMLARTAG